MNPYAVSLPEGASAANLIFCHALEAVDAYQLTKNALRLENTTLFFSEQVSVSFAQRPRVYVVGAGKAVTPMAKAVEESLGDYMAAGAVITKYGHAVPLQKIDVTEAAHPISDIQGVNGTHKIINLLSQTQAGDVVLVLLSGGGSALLADVPPGCTLEDMQVVGELLLRCGATIHEVNTVRKHLSVLKGGQLARLAAPARVITLVVSDVIGDPLDVIASGPTVPDPTTFADAWQVVQKYRLEPLLPASVVMYLQAGRSRQMPDTPKATEPFFAQVSTFLLGNNTHALEAAAAKARQLGYHTSIRSHTLSGEAREQAIRLVAEARNVAADTSIPKPCCLLYGGETTVTLQGDGQGGRNQELALAAAIQLKGTQGITLLSAGTDGTDGPTEMAGAWADGETLQRAGMSVQEARQCLDTHNSYLFFVRSGGHIYTGPTHTNVMDMQVLLIDRV